VSARGYALPLSPSGTASLVPAPPWHYAGTLMSIEFWADPAAVRASLPPGLDPSAVDIGRCTAFFADWQFCSDGRHELQDPIRSQYREFFIATSASYHGEDVFTCPYIWVDQDVSMLRGWIQGFPKKLGTIHVTRAFELPGAASTPVQEGTTFAATCTAAGQRIAAATITIERPARAAGKAERPHPRLINLRKFPRLDAGRHNDPAVLELVSPMQRDTLVSDGWEGQPPYGSNRPRARTSGSYGQSASAPGDATARHLPSTTSTSSRTYLHHPHTAPATPMLPREQAHRDDSDIGHAAAAHTARLVPTRPHLHCCSAP
jgi:acetoacetate decarboxylase